MKKSWPFRLGTTSFIYPDNIIPNVKKLGRDFDEIELLIFESIPEQVLPSKNNIKELVSLSEALDITYNIHLPTDVSFCDTSPAKRTEAIDTVKKVMELCAPLNPTTHTLHLDFTRKDAEGGIDGIKKWQHRAFESLEKFISFCLHPESVSIETLDYPFEYLDGIIDEFGLSVCIDAGHMIKYQFDIIDIFNRYKTKIPLIHFHGVDFSTGVPKDHLSLDRTPNELMNNTIKILKKFKGVVSIEVFNHENLLNSMDYLNRIQLI